MKKYVGVDIGGMTIKGIIIDETGKEYASGVTPTGCGEGGDKMCRNIKLLVESMLAEIGEEKAECVGIGCPGMIDSANGVVVFAGNLNLKNFPLGKKVGEMLGMQVKVTNDANAAALGEARYGAGKNYEDSILVTLGTGVGGGVVIGGKLFEGYRSAGAELGHMVIAEGGEPCTCGRRGCFEAYSSASALMKKTAQAMREHPESAMWQEYTPETVSGRTCFEYPDDPAAKDVLDWYVRHMACGLANLANIFRPQVIMLGGGVSEQGEKLTGPINELFQKEVFGDKEFAPVKLVKASLGSRAGAFGAASLAME